MLVECNSPEEYPANRLLGLNFWAKLLGLALIWVLKVTDGLGVWIVRLDELSVKLGVSLFCLDTVELVELPVNWKKSIETKVEKSLYQFRQKEWVATNFLH